MDILAVIACLLIFCKHNLVICDEGIDRYVSYQGFGDLALACNGSEVINITGFDLTNHATSCHHQTCALSENDQLIIENCNDNSTCLIPIHNMSGCITQTGFYNVEYTCKTKALTCDFDHNRCNIQGTGTWTVDEARRAGSGYRDHTLGVGYGRMLYIINGQSGETKITNRVSSSPIQCLSFWYWGNTVGYLTVYREHRDGSIDSIDRFPNGNGYNKFMRNLIDIGDYYLRFKATGDSINSQFLIDDITIINADCDESRDAIAFRQTCKNVDDVTELQGCSKYYIENITSHFDPLKERCYDLLNDQATHICNSSSDLIYCDARQLVNTYPSCFNLNTLMINYTCKEDRKDTSDQEKKDSVNIGLVVGAVSGGLIACFAGVVLFIIYSHHKRQENWHSNNQGTSTQTPVSDNTDTTGPEHKYVTISTAYEAIIEPSTENSNNQNSCHTNDPNVYDDLASPSYTNMNDGAAHGNENIKATRDKSVEGNQVIDNYTTLEANEISNPNVYDDLASPIYINTNDDIVTVNDYEEPVHG